MKKNEAKSLAAEITLNDLTAANGRKFGEVIPIVMTKGDEDSYGVELRFMSKEQYGAFQTYSHRYC